MEQASALRGRCLDRTDYAKDRYDLGTRGQNFWLGSDGCLLPSYSDASAALTKYLRFRGGLSTVRQISVVRFRVRQKLPICMN